MTRWTGEEQPDERRLRALLAAENAAPYAWGNPPHDRYPSHSHPYHKTVYCIVGSITFDVPGERIELLPGDRLDLPPGVEHAARVGAEGVICLEAHRNR